MTKRKVTKVIVHCTDTPTGRKVSVKDIDLWHKQRGFKASSNGHICGYHWVVCIDGVIEMGRDEKDIGAHCENHNFDSIGICLVGRGEYTLEQYNALYFLLEDTLYSYDLKPKDVYGHYEFNEAKTCPMIKMDEIRSKLTAHIQGGQCGSTS